MRAGRAPRAGTAAWECLRQSDFGPSWASPGDDSRVGFMKLLLTLGVVVGVIFAINKFRQRGDADLWHEVTAR